MFVSCYSLMLLMLQLLEGFPTLWNVRQSKWLNLVPGTWWLFQWDDSNSSNEKCLFHQTSIHKKSSCLGFQVGKSIGFDGSLIYGSKSEVGIGIPTGVADPFRGTHESKWGARFKMTKARQWYCWWFGNAKQPSGMYKTLANNGINDLLSTG